MLALMPADPTLLRKAAHAGSPERHCLSLARPAAILQKAGAFPLRRCRSPEREARPLLLGSAEGGLAGRDADGVSGTVR